MRAHACFLRTWRACMCCTMITTVYWDTSTHSVNELHSPQVCAGHADVPNILLIHWRWRHIIQTYPGVHTEPKATRSGSHSRQVVTDWLTDSCQHTSSDPIHTRRQLQLDQWDVAVKLYAEDHRSQCAPVSPLLRDQILCLGLSGRVVQSQGCCPDAIRHSHSHSSQGGIILQPPGLQSGDTMGEFGIT